MVFARSGNTPHYPKKYNFTVLFNVVWYWISKSCGNHWTMEANHGKILKNWAYVDVKTEHSLHTCCKIERFGGFTIAWKMEAKMAPNIRWKWELWAFQGWIFMVFKDFEVGSFLQDFVAGPLDTGRLKHDVWKRRHRQVSAGSGRHRRTKSYKNRWRMEANHAKIHKKRCQNGAQISGLWVIFTYSWLCRNHCFTAVKQRLFRIQGSANLWNINNKSM